VGGCHLRILEGLAERHEFTVFAVEFENPSPQRIRWVRIPLPVRPYVALYLLYHLVAPLAYFYQRVVRGVHFDLVQMVESNLLFGTLSYSHFCHRFYLAQHWTSTNARGIRGCLRQMAHRAAALFEPTIYRRVACIVAPSRGLVNELRQVYPETGNKARLLPNPVDLESLKPPDERMRLQERKRQGIADELVLLFVALGHFERKGLPLVMEAIRDLEDTDITLLVVGGERHLIAQYKEMAAAMGISARVRFAGLQQDLRPYYWAADAFVLPSCYEVFPLVALEAAAAGLPLLATPVNGVEEILTDSYNGFVLERNARNIAVILRRLAAMTAGERRRMGLRARKTVLGYGSATFVAGWQKIYDSLA